MSDPQETRVVTATSPEAMEVDGEEGKSDKDWDDMEILSQQIRASEDDDMQILSPQARSVASSSRKRQARSVEADADVPKRKKAKVGRSRKRQARSKDEEEKKDVIESDDEPICKKIRVMPVNDRLNAHLTHLNGQKKAETKEFLGMLQEFRIHGEISAEKVCPIVFLDCCMSFFLLFPPPNRANNSGMVYPSGLRTR